MIHPWLSSGTDSSHIVGSDGGETTPEESLDSSTHPHPHPTPTHRRRHTQPILPVVLETPIESAHSSGSFPSVPGGSNSTRGGSTGGGSTGGGSSGGGSTGEGSSCGSSSVRGSITGGGLHINERSISGISLTSLPCFKGSKDRSSELGMGVRRFSDALMDELDKSDHVTGGNASSSLSVDKYQHQHQHQHQQKNNVYLEQMSRERGELLRRSTLQGAPSSTPAHITCCCCCCCILSYILFITTPSLTPYYLICSNIPYY